MLLDYSLAELITRIGVLLVAMTIHELAHAYVAYRMGDPTAANEGRLTLNPFAHIHWIGFAMFVLVGFGILGTAPIDPNRIRKRWGYLAALAAGPFSNLLLAIVVALPVRFDLLPAAYPVFSRFLPRPAEIIGAMIYWNVLLFVFNLLPLFPIDGWTVVRELLPMSAFRVWERHRVTTQYILYGLIIWSYLASRVGRTLPLQAGLLSKLNPLYYLIGVPTDAIIRVLIGN